MKTDKMKAMVANGYGSPDVFQLQEVDIPVINENEVLIKVHASSATTADTMMRTGKPYFGRLMTGLRKPKHPIPGTGFAGEVVQTGSDIKGFKPGDRVFGETTLGFSTNAEYVAIPSQGVILHMPEGMKYNDAACFCDGVLTSWNFLKDIANVSAGQRVLINGASGSLGTAAVQLAKHLGAEVSAVCSKRNVGLVKSLGADHVIDYVKEDFSNSKQEWDVIFDTVGKSSFSKAKKVLSDKGQYISPVLKFSLLFQMMGTSVCGKKKARFAATGLKKDDELRYMLSELIEVYKSGKINIVIDRQYPLEKLAEAHRYIDTGRKKGNVVISIDH